MLPSLCKSYDIILLQEHWLLPNEICKLDSVSCGFLSVATSAMTDDMKISSSNSKIYIHFPPSLGFRQNYQIQLEHFTLPEQSENNTIASADGETLSVCKIMTREYAYLSKQEA